MCGNLKRTSSKGKKKFSREKKSFQGKKAEIVYLCASVKPDLILVSESKLDSDIKHTEFLPAQYTGHIRKDHTRHYGGVMIVHKKDLVIDELEVLDSDHHDHIVWARISLCNASPMYIGSYYRSNSCNNKETITALKASLESAHQDPHKEQPKSDNYCWRWLQCQGRRLGQLLSEARSVPRTTLRSRHWDTAGAPPGTAPEITDLTRLNLGPILHQQTGTSEVYQPYPGIHGRGPWVHCDRQLDHSWALEESTQEVLQVVKSQLDWNQGEDCIIRHRISEPESENSPG